MSAYGPDGHDCGQLPTPGELPELPPAWCEGLHRDTVVEMGTARDGAALLDGLPVGVVSAEVAEAVAVFDDEIASGSDRHSAMLRAQKAVLTKAAMGFGGADDGLRLLKAKVIDEALRNGSKRSRADLDADWDRALKGAARLVALNRGVLAEMGPGGKWHHTGTWEPTGEY